MIHEVKVNFEREPKADREAISVHPADYNNALTKLTSIISDLNNRSENYCIVVQVTKAQSLANGISFTKQLDSLIRQLTKRELEIFDLAVNGLSNRLIAEKLFIAVETVRSHRKNIVGKAGATSIEEIKTWLLKTKL